MNDYQVLLEESPGHPAERIEIRASSPSAVFSWAERCAHGRRFEIFHDGASLGRAALSSGANFWILSPASAGPADHAPAVQAKVAR